MPVTHQLTSRASGSQPPSTLGSNHPRHHANKIPPAARVAAGKVHASSHTALRSAIRSLSNPWTVSSMLRNEASMEVAIAHAKHPPKRARHTGDALHHNSHSATFHTAAAITRERVHTENSAVFVGTQMDLTMVRTLSSGGNMETSNCSQTQNKYEINNL